MTQSIAPHVVAILQLPPPVTGLSAVNQRMVEELTRAGKLAAVANVAPPEGARGLNKHFGRLVRTVSAARLLVRLRAHGVTTVYMPSDGGAGMVWNIVLMLVARAMRYRIWVHHHSFAYVNRRSGLMALQLALAPRGTRHLALCQTMLDGLMTNYSIAWSRGGHVGLVLPNSFIPDSAPTPASAVGDFVIGHLANLTVAKGVLRFISLFRAAKEEGLAIRAIAAGPVGDARARDAIERVAQDFPGSFEWAGPLYGERKADFYRSLDSFVFPSDYENEAQPLVLLEALAGGAAVLVTRRGCMDCDHSGSPGLTADIEAFQGAALEWLRQHVQANARKPLKQLAAATFARMKAEGETALSQAIRDF